MSSTANPSSPPRRIALVTGGSRGLGRSAALALAARGWAVVFTYRTRRDEAEAALAEIARGGGDAAALPLDTADTAGFPAFTAALQALLAERWQRDRLDAIVHNAGIGVQTPFAETSEAQFDALMAVHLKGPYFLTQALLPLIADGGRILHLSTGLTRFSLPGFSAYAAMKGGIEVLTRYLAKELGPRRIAVNTLAPGAIETDFGGGTVRDSKPLNDAIAAQTALGRVGRPEDIGGVVAALLGDDHRWVNAQRIEASGGMFV